VFSLGVACPAWVDLLEEMPEAEARAHPPRTESEYRILVKRTQRRVAS
jgi:hypothetical protein